MPDGDFFCSARSSYPSLGIICPGVRRLMEAVMGSRAIGGPLLSHGDRGSNPRTGNTSSSIKALLLALFVVAQSVAAAARLGRATAARSQVSLQRWFYALRSFFVTLRASFRSSSHRPGEEESGDDIRDADYFRSANRGRARPVLERERRDLGGGHERDGDAPALKRKPTFFACVPRLPRGTKSCG